MISKRNSVKALLVCGLLCAGWAQSSLAHYVWIEKNGKNEAKVYFGGFMEVHEKSGGRLDEMSKLEFWQWQKGSLTPSPAPWEKKEDHLLVPALREPVALLAHNTAYEVKDWRKYEIGVVKPMFYARFQEVGKQAAEPFLDLDVMMTQKNQCGVFFKKQPLPGAKVTIYAPNGWTQEHKSKEDGRAAVETPWPGQYVLEVIHKEAAPGSFGGKDYEAVRHRATCTFVRK